MDTQGNVRAPAVTLESLYQMVLTMRPYVRARIRNDAEDCMHDTVLAVAEALEENRVRNIRCLRAYVWTTLKRTMRARISAGNRLEPLKAIERKPMGTASPERQAIASQVCERIRNLRAADQEILNRTYMAQETNEEICVALHIGRGQLRVRQLRARRRLLRVLLFLWAVGAGMWVIQRYEWIMSTGGYISSPVSPFAAPPGIKPDAPKRALP